MKRSMFGVMFAALLTLSLSVAARATTTDALQLTSGGLLATIDDNGACVGTGCATLSGDISLTAGTDTITGTINGWNISITSGTTNSPDTTPFGIAINTLTAVCTLSGGCAGGNTLDIQYTDQNFSGPVPLSSNLGDTFGSGTSGTVSQSAYYDSSNGQFAETSQIGTTLTFNGTSSGVVGPTTGAATPYSLTLDDKFSANTKNSSFGVTGNIVSTAVPEGWSLSSALGMLGFGVVALVAARRRGLVKTSV